MIQLQTRLFSPTSLVLGTAIAVRFAMALTILSSATMVSVRGQEAGGLEIAQVSGELEAAVGYQIKLKTDEDKEILAIVDPNKTNFSYSGTADPKFLMPGILVRFTAAFDQNGKPQGPIQEMEIFSPFKKQRMTNEFMRDQTPGIYPVQDKKEPTPEAAAGFQNYRIVGKIAAMQADTLRIAAGPRPLMVQLDPAATIKVSAGDTTFCMKGDRVEVTGLRNPGQEQYVQAENITITGAKPLEPPEPKTRGARNRRDKGAANNAKANSDG